MKNLLVKGQEGQRLRCVSHCGGKVFCRNECSKHQQSLARAWWEVPHGDRR